MSPFVRHPLTIGALLGAGVLAVALTACGGGEAASSSPTPTASSAAPASPASTPSGAATPSTLPVAPITPSPSSTVSPSATVSATASSGAETADLIESKLGASGIQVDAGSLRCDEQALTAGAAVDCTATSGGKPFAVQADVTKASGKDVTVAVTTQPLAVPAATLAANLAELAGKQVNLSLTGTCAGDLATEVGSTTTCTVRAATGQTRDFKVTTLGVDGVTVSFGAEVVS